MVQKTPGEIFGQSVTTMPSGRHYTTASRAKFQSGEGATALEIDYDTNVRDGEKLWHVLWVYRFSL